MGLIRMLFAAPSDSVIVKFMSALSPYLSKRSSEIVPLLIEKMKSQPKLSEQMAISSDEYIIQSLVFERLAPLLVLKVCLNADNNAVDECRF